jgi:hypothetical protein
MKCCIPAPVVSISTKSRLGFQILAQESADGHEFLSSFILMDHIVEVVITPPTLCCSPVQVLTVFFTSLVAGSFLNQLQQLVANPTSIVRTLGAAAPQTAVFFMTYLLLLGLTTKPISFLRLPRVSPRPSLLHDISAASHMPPPVVVVKVCMLPGLCCWDSSPKLCRFCA